MSYSNNRQAGLQYDASGNLTNDGGQTYQYDATGQQTYASGTGLEQHYDGDGLRVKKTEQYLRTYYVRSSVLGKQVIVELESAGNFQRGYVYLGGQLLALQQSGTVSWVHQDPITKSQRVTDVNGAVTTTKIDLDPWGGETVASANATMQPQRFTTYTRDANGGDEAMMRRYSGAWQRFSQPDPYSGSYNLADPQSLNRYSYVQNDPVNFVDPTGLYWVLVNCRAETYVEDGAIFFTGREICNLAWVAPLQPITAPGGSRGPIGLPPEPKPEPQGGMGAKKERCANAVREAENARNHISTRLQNAIRVGGLDQTHQKSISQSLNQLKNAVAEIAKNCFGDDGPNGPPLFPEFESSIRLSQQAAEEFKVPPVGWDGGRTAAETRIKAAAFFGAIGSTVSAAASGIWTGVRWVLRSQ